MKKSSKAGSDLTEVMAKFNKDHGPGTIRLLSEGQASVEVFSTGILGLDKASGGGVPKGRILEFFGQEASGKTTLALHIIAAVQEAGGKCMFIDAEQAFDPDYARAIGVDVESLYFSYPDYGEMALDLAEEVCKTGEMDLIVIDSVSALTPKAELEGNNEKATMGLQARMMSQALRSLPVRANKGNTTIIFINQMREKIGVMFGCFDYNTKVIIEGGAELSIGEIVEKRLPVKVLSYNETTGAIEPKQVVNWYNNGRYDKLWSVRTPLSKGGCAKAVVGDDHVFLTPDGERKLSEMKNRDLTYVRDMRYLNPDQMSLAFGSFLGKGIFRTKDNASSFVKLKGGTAGWLASLLPSSFINSPVGQENGVNEYRSENTLEFLPFLRGSTTKRGVVTSITKELADLLDPVSLAVWYLDRGRYTFFKKTGKVRQAKISVRGLDAESREIMASRIEEVIGVAPQIHKNNFLFSGEDCKTFMDAIAPHIPQEFEDLLHVDFRGGYKYDFDATDVGEITLLPSPIWIGRTRPRANPYKYDIQVEGNSNYFAGGHLVHNSPWTTTGGNALKFYSSIRMEVSKSVESRDKDNMPTSFRMKVKIVKNKVAPPFKKCDFLLQFGSGISKVEDLMSMSIEEGIVERKGSWFHYDGQKFQGKANLLETLEEDPDFFDHVRNATVNKMYGIVEDAEFVDSEGATDHVEDTHEVGDVESVDQND